MNTESDSKHCTSWRLDDVVNNSILFGFLCVEIVIPVEVMLDLQHIDNGGKKVVFLLSRLSLHDRLWNVINVPAQLACRWLLLASC